ncbi:hypothetical protein [Microvirga sp. KLBC 81]|uniref:hypothetical protein n=1 Tax=Microvirga sp. KLBC 81 TaxID=1862707 RepID=UPI00197BFAA5|nr:hypothetical protein [Microvirga sp. KLBC 81]
MAAEVVRYKRERWVTPQGQTIIAPLPPGLTGGFGPGARRFCLALHTQGQVTAERLTELGCSAGADAGQCVGNFVGTHGPNICRNVPFVAALFFFTGLHSERKILRGQRPLGGFGA